MDPIPQNRRLVPAETPATAPKETKKPPHPPKSRSKIETTSKLAEMMALESKANDVPHMYLNFEIKLHHQAFRDAMIYFIELLVGSMHRNGPSKSTHYPRSKTLFHGFLGELTNRANQYQHRKTRAGANRKNPTSSNLRVKV